ncbi:GPI transamidase component PIG-S [Biomphalaria glabrata]|uniref:GPI transamidase component PIG-S n=1 Tax=Biomphalaria glabrata TaxID=6526 RepID=A0A2C9LS43_BIOGL|nr:GPI transamidase component PIG-S [Biomphalaria glabrata]
MSMNTGETESKTENQNENSDSEKEKRTAHTAALTLGILCIVVGLPLWWKTTEVYRFSLPYSDIQHLSDKKIEYLIEAEVIWASPVKKDALFLTDLAQHLNRFLGIQQHHASRLSSIFRVSVREGETSELVAIQKVTKLADLENILSSDNLNKYNIVVVKESSIITQPLIAPKNCIFLPYNGADVNGLTAQIAHLLLDVSRNNDVAKSMETAQGLKLQRPDKDTMRSFRYHAGYDLTFTLMVPEPEQMNVDWTIEQGIEDYLSPLVKSLEEYTQISVTSQILYLVSLGGKPKNNDGFYFYSEQDLPHVINPLETKLGSHASNNPGLNFIVCIPARDKSPLHLVDNNGVPIASNAFLSPRWGGIMIYNIDTVNSSSHQSSPVDVDIHRVMEVFVTQLRLLLNIHPQWMTKDLMVLNTGSSELHMWELSGWLRCRCVENLVTATSTLQSLAKLLEEIGNIVINDEIGKEVEAAVAAIEESQLLLKNGKLKEAFLASKAAFNASELAFFHPSLLELLYFPEDQKFAIYIPLFLPISIPVVTSVIQALRWFKQQKKLKSD